MSDLPFFKELPLTRLRRCSHQLRPVRKETVDYYRLRDSIRDMGLDTPLLCRPFHDDYEVVDGGHRLEVMLDLRFGTAPCYIKPMTDEEVLRKQIEAHATRIETRPLEYAARLRQIVKVDHLLTVEQVAKEVHQTVEWVKRIMGLVYLSPNCKRIMEAERLPVSVALELAKMPVDDQDELVRLVGTMPAMELRDLLRAKARHSRENTKADRVSTRQTHNINPEYRHFLHVEQEYNCPTVAASVLSRANARTALDGWNAAVQWIMQMDETTLAERINREAKRRQKEVDLETVRQNELSLRRNT